MRVHLPGLPHTETVVDEWDQCAFTGKIRRLADMLTMAGHDVILYAGEHNDAACAEHVVCVTAADRARWFGDETYADTVFDRWSEHDRCWAESNTAIIDAIAQRIEPHDLIALPIGSVQRAISDAFPTHISFESGVGYEGSWLPYRVFESRAWQHHTYGRQGIDDGRFYDTVIPNAVNPADFDYTPDHDGYLLFLGRHTPRKGLAVVEEIAKHHRVVSAGQGDPIPGVEHVGVVRGRKRAELLAGARGLLAPTLYVEPFGGVAVEAQMTGKPVIATPWGAFPETIEPGVTGFLPHTLAGFLEAVDRLDELDPFTIHQRAVARYGVAAISDQYDTYLHRLDGLHADGWYDLEGALA